MDASLVDNYRETLIPVITDNLLPDDMFVSRSQNDSAYVNSDVVKLPQRGLMPGIERNREAVPAQAKKRQDTVHAYNLSEFTTTPTYVSLNNEVVVSYNKAQSMLKDHIDLQNVYCAESALDVWSPDGGGLTNTSRIFETTGDARAAGVIPSWDEAGSPIELTGNRKRITKADFTKMAEIFNRNNIPQMGRVCLLTASQLDDLLQIAEFTDANKVGSNMTALKEGVVGRMAGFDIMVRSSVLFYSADATAKRNNVDRDDIIGGDCEAAIFWHPSFVRRAMGSVDVFLEVKSPTYYGDIMSTSVRFGGDTWYANGKGVYILKDGVA